MAKDDSPGQSPTPPGPAKGGLAGWQTRRLSKLAAEGLAGLTVSRLAAEVSLSPYHFSRAFRVSFGASPREWLIGQRIEQAKLRLRSGQESIERIAQELGYSSSSQFARTFRTQVGCSPVAFRRQ